MLALIVLFIFSLVREAIVESIVPEAESFDSYNSINQLQSNKNILLGLILINKLFINFWFSFFNLNFYYIFNLKVRSSYFAFVNKFLSKQLSFQTIIFNAINLNFSSYLMSSTLNSIFFNNLFFFKNVPSKNFLNLTFFLKNIKKDVFAHWFLGVSK